MHATLMSHVSNVLYCHLQEASTESDNLFAGLCAVVQQWLKDGALLNA